MIAAGINLGGIDFTSSVIDSGMVSSSGMRPPMRGLLLATLSRDSSKRVQSICFVLILMSSDSISKLNYLHMVSINFESLATLSLVKV